LISEGVGDLIFIGNSLWNRNFTWKTYLQQKLISLAINRVSGGFKGFRDTVT
jgi:hypothetical protein